MCIRDSCVCVCVTIYYMGGWAFGPKIVYRRESEVGDPRKFCLSGEKERERETERERERDRER